MNGLSYSAGRLVRVIKKEPLGSMDLVVGVGFEPTTPSAVMSRIKKGATRLLYPTKFGCGGWI